MAKLPKKQTISAATYDSVAVLFVLKGREDNGKLYARITVNGERGPERSTGIKVSKGRWNSKTQQLATTDRESQQINVQLSKLKTMIYEARSDMERKGETITSRKLVEQVFDHQAIRYTLQNVYSLYTTESKTLKNLSHATYQTYDRYVRNTGKYFASIGRKEPLLDEITKDHFLAFINWLTDQYERDYAVKIAQFARSLFNYAESNGMIEHNPLTSIRLEKSNEYDTTHLTQEEVRKLAAFDFTKIKRPLDSIRVLEEERDAFVFCCFSGLHHTDYCKGAYTLEKILGRTWLSGYRVKSKGERKDKPYSMPLHPLALAIIEKYGGVAKLPKRNNAKRNRVLKEIAALVGLDLNLTTMIGRKTLADYCLNVEGMREEIVAAILGHSSTKFLKHYTKITNMSIDREMTFKDLKTTKKRATSTKKKPGNYER